MSELIKYFSVETGLASSSLERLIMDAPNRYKTYTIPKRNGGTRTISQPAREIKHLQRLFSDKFLLSADIHDCSTAYREGYSILNNAMAHRKNGAILKVDFKDFFPSIDQYDWEKYCQRKKLLDRHDIRLSSHLLFKRERYHSNLKLSIGAPTSPILSNILMYEFDKSMLQFCVENKITYTRYADDLTFSASRLWFMIDVIKHIKQTIREIPYPRKLVINTKKTTFVTKKYKRQITGLVISNNEKVSIGRDNKKKIHARYHHAVNNKISDFELCKLKGYLSYIKMIDQDFYEKLISRYGDL